LYDVVIDLGHRDFGHADVRARCTVRLLSMIQGRLSTNSLKLFEFNDGIGNHAFDELVITELPALRATAIRRVPASSQSLGCIRRPCASRGECVRHRVALARP